jgi:hypothetical protein
MLTQLLHCTIHKQCAVIQFLIEMVHKLQLPLPHPLYSLDHILLPFWTIKAYYMHANFQDMEE